MKVLSPKRVLLIMLALASLIAAAQPAAPVRAQVELSCESFGMGPLLDCTVRLRSGDALVSGAQLTLGATMPSMPMAHSVKPVPALPTGRPGEYRGRLELEMNGVWAVHVDIAASPTLRRDRVARSLLIDECPDGKRCPVPPAPGASPRKP